MSSGVDHKLEFGIGLRWQVGHNAETSDYIEVASPLDQNRPGGDPPRPYADVPRYAWTTTTTGLVHIAGWCQIQVTPGGPTRNPVNEWRAVDLYIPTENIIQLQTYRHDDWEGKPADPEEENNHAK